MVWLRRVGAGSETVAGLAFDPVATIGTAPTAAARSVPATTARGPGG